MATSLGNLTVDLRTNTAKFNQGMDSARGKLQNFGRSISVVKTAVVALAGAGGLGLLVKRTLETIDTLAKTADRLGFTTQELAKLRYAAELTGVKTVTLDMALQRMTRRLAEAANGTGEAVAAIKELGLDAEKLAAMGPDRAFKEIAGAMQGVSNQSDRVRLAFKFFDSEGVKLVNTLALGTDGLNQAGMEAEFFGKAISRVDAKAVEDANDSMTRAKTIVGGLADELTVALAPALEAAAMGLVEFTRDVRELIGLIPLEDQMNQKIAEGLKLRERLWQLQADGNARGQQAVRDQISLVDQEIQQLQRKIYLRDRDKQLAEEARAARQAEAKIRYEYDSPDWLDAQVEAYQNYQEEKTRIAEKEAEKRRRVEEQVAADIQNMQMSVFQNAANFLRAVAPESKKAAIAVIAIEKGLAIAQTVINTEVAAMRALAELGPVAGAAAAAKIRTLGSISVALIGATGLAQAASVNAGSTTAGTVTQASTQTPSQDAFSPFNTPESRGSLTINIYNPELLSDQSIDRLVDGIRDRVDDRDVILIRPESRNGQDLIR